MTALLTLAAWTSAGACSLPYCAPVHPRAPDVILFLGHSIINGNGDDAYFGDRPVPEGVTYRHAGTTRTTWVTAPSIAPYLVARMPRPCTVVVRGQGGATMAQIAGTHWTNAQADLSALGVVPDRVVVWSGENDTGTTIARDAYAATLETLLDSIEDTYPSAEIDVVQSLGDAGTMVYIADIRAAQASVVAAEPARRHLVDPRSPGWAPLQTDRVHLVPGPGGGNDVVARLLMGVW